ncbi:MAG: hypothetical protein LIQ31_13205 [Planctomycetes bacterium]|nr:hypothetical protein [Planctomycetota bacterium]
MKRQLKSIAMQLTESDIQELIRLKKQGDKKTVALRKRRDKVAAELARLDAELKKISGEEPAAGAKTRGRPRQAQTAKSVKTAKAGKTAAAAKTPKKAKAAKTAGGKKRKANRVNISAAVREVFKKANEPLRARQVVDLLGDAGVKVTDVQEMRKRVSVVLAQAKDTFEQVERGVYRLKENA